MEYAYETYYANRSQERSDSSSAARQGHNARRNLSKEGSRLFFALAIALLFGACIRDLDGGARERIIVGDSTALVTLSLSTPAPPTRTVPGSANENKVVDVDVLLFTTDNDKLYYRAPATSTAITDLNPSPYLNKTFTVRLPINPLNGSTPIPYKMVIIANARTSVAGYAPNSILSSGPDRQTLLNGLASTAAGAKLAYPFPMWGEYASNLTITETSTPGTLNVDLTRAVARVDVSLDTDVANFELDSVLLYNYRDAGHVAPKYELGSPTAACYPAGNKVPGSFLGYDLTGTTDPNGKAFQEIIYAFEAANVALTDPDWMKNTCLVVGGRFGGNTNTTYYRVEFVDDHDAPLDLTRNYLYNVVIDEVKADGWPGPWLAYTNKPSNIVVKITEWNDGGMNEIKFNDQNYLAVDKSHIDFYKEGLSKSLRVVTDYPSGWTIEELPEWLTLVSTTPPAAAGVQSTLLFTAVPDNPDDVPRSGHFYIVAGNLRKEITVAQSADEEFSLEVNPWEITFNKTPTAETVTVSPVPAADGANYALTFGASANIENSFWASGFGLPTLNTTTTFQLKPEINESGADISGTVLVTFTGPLGQTITRTVSIKQLAYDIFEALLSNPYPISGGSQTFIVKSTVPWRLSNSDDWIELAETSEEHSPTSSYTYTFTLDPITTYTPTRTAVVNVASSDSALPANTKFEIRQEGAALTLIVTSPAATGDPLEHVLDFGGWVGSRTVTLSTNAPWTFATGAGYSDVVASAKIGNTDLVAGVTQSEGHTPDLPNLTPTITFTPFVDQSSGTTVVTFSTVVPGTTGVMNISETVTLKRDMTTYMFSEDRKTLTLFTNFPRGTDLAGLNETNVPELQDPEFKDDVTTLVMLGDKNVITGEQMSGIKSKRDVQTPANSLLPSLVNVSLPDFDGPIPNEAFAGTSQADTWLKSANFPKATHVGDRAFRYCDNLTSINAPLVQNIGENAFDFCWSLTEVSFPEVMTIGRYAFAACFALTDASLPKATDVEMFAFASCLELANVYIPNLTGIKDATFSYCKSLTEVFFPNVTYLKNSAFYGCLSLRVVDVPNAYDFDQLLFAHSASTLTLKINDPAGPITFTNMPFQAVGGDPNNGSDFGTGTTQMTLYLGPVDDRPSGTYPLHNVEWKNLTWGTIYKYEDQ